MATIIGRKQEQDDLMEWCHSRKAELVCVYGRRRVGKTYLVKSAFRDRLAFSVTGSEDKQDSTQMRIFKRALKQCGAKNLAGIHDWFDAFDCLRSLLEAEGVVRAAHGRRVVFLDEFPWMAGKRSGFLTAFADFWNSWATHQEDVMIVICGSATSWIVKNLFENTGSLYNRITRRLYLAPFNLYETKQMIDSMDLGWGQDSILQSYLVFGGLPYYLDMLDRRLSLAQNIDALCLDVHAPLHDEVPRLMEATLSDSVLHRNLLMLLSSAKVGIHRRELSKKVGSSGGGIKRALDDLEKCGYIRKYRNPYEKYHPTIYQLIDPFLLFSLRFMGEDSLASWSTFEGSPAYYAWRGNAFEIACLSHIPQIKRALGIAAVQTECFPWTSISSTPRAQIDLVIERKDGVTDLCEMKYTDEPLASSQNLVAELRRKRSAFREESATKNTVHLALVSASGVKSEAYFEGVSTVVTSDDLFLP